jgi:hypothetical protein
MTPTEPRPAATSTDTATDLPPTDILPTLTSTPTNAPTATDLSIALLVATSIQPTLTEPATLEATADSLSQRTQANSEAAGATPEPDKAPIHATADPLRTLGWVALGTVVVAATVLYVARRQGRRVSQ